jgi:hypothetical protein
LVNSGLIWTLKKPEMSSSDLGKKGFHCTSTGWVLISILRTPHGWSVHHSSSYKVERLWRIWFSKA